MESSDKHEYDQFFSQERNYIILTNSGKPVFCAHGNMYTLSSVFATLYAIISKVQTYQFQDIDIGTQIAEQSKNSHAHLDFKVADELNGPLGDQVIISN